MSNNVNAKTDTITNIVLQIRKSIDLGGDLPIVFQDGSKIRLTANAMDLFLSRYEKLKPCDREIMQQIAVRSPEDFEDTLEESFNLVPAPKSIYL